MIDSGFIGNEEPRREAGVLNTQRVWFELQRATCVDGCGA